MVASAFVGLLAIFLQTWVVRAAVELEVNVTAITGEVESDWTSVYYSNKKPLLLGNDGGPDKGGFHVFDLNADSPLPEVTARRTGRSKLVATVHDVAGKDVAVNIAAPDSVLRVFEMPEFKHIESADFKVLGDWSALCPWKSDTGNDYLFLFGKNKAVQFLIREKLGKIGISEIQTFAVPFEASGCTVSRSQSRLYLSGDDDSSVYAFDLAESTKAPKITSVGKAEDEVTGLATYVAEKGDYLFVALESKVAVYDPSFKLAGTITLTGYKKIEVQGLNIYQAATSRYPAGALTFSIESKQGKGFGVVALQDVLKSLSITPNTAYNPRKLESKKNDPICRDCSLQGFCGGKGRCSTSKCECFAGLTGRSCEKNTCVDDCSGHGKCVGPNVCECEKGWGGLHCSFLLVEPTLETDSLGGDGDDPAIWISPKSPDESRVIITVKSGPSTGLGVLDLKGKLIQTVKAGKPNNVDIIYGFKAGDRKVDLVYAACREDDTLCLFEMLPNGTVTSIPGGAQPVVDDYTVYGSCVYRSRKTGKQYLFVNEKSARYLQYELTASSDGTLQTKLVRDFKGGSGGQVEGCVTDEENGWIFLGEEPSALWRYDAEPDGGDKGIAIARVGDGKLHGDVEGVALVLGSKPNEGFVLVSCQGVSAYNVYERAAPHKYVTTFTVTKSANGEFDAVSNTDGLTAVGTALGKDFPHGLLVLHDDANELPDGTTSSRASFKMVSLKDVLGSEKLGIKGLLDKVDSKWDPRKS